MNKDKFFRKIFYNVILDLSTDRRDFFNLFQSLTSYNSYFPPSVNDYVNDCYNTHYDEAEKSGNKKYITYDDYITKKELCHILEIIEQEFPDVLEPFKPSPNIDFIGDYLELNDQEKLIFQFYSFCSETGRNDQNIFESVLSRYDTAPFMLEKLLGLDPKYLQMVFNYETDLLSSGLLHFNENGKLRGFYTVIQSIHRLLERPVLNEEILIRELFPNRLDTELSIEDYHQEKDIGILESILNSSVEEKHQGINCLLYGLPGTGKTELPILLAKKNNWNLIVIGDIGRSQDNEKSRQERLLNLKIAQKIFKKKENQRTVLLFDEMEDLFKFDIDASFSKAFMNRIVEKTEIPIIWTTNNLDDIDQPILRRMTYGIQFRVPPEKTRHKIWKKYKDKHGIQIKDEVLEQLSRNYDVVPALISNAIKVAKMSNLADTDIYKVIDSLDTTMNYGRSRRISNSPNINSEFNVDFINCDIDIKALTNNIKSTGKKNFSLCLYGPPGTGKSAYGKWLAQELEMKVLFKRASDLLDMYVGETEQRIKAAFEEAQDDQALLIIDEADSFLSSRKDSNTNWMISMVNEMLTQMESHPWPFVCTTNLIDRLDEASLRRFTFKIKYDFLKRDQIDPIFEFYFNVKAPNRLKNNEILTPGDFANVKRKADIMGVVDSEELARMLEDECKHKPQFTRTIGFESPN